MRKNRLVTLALAATTTLVLTYSGSAGAVVELKGCCCVAGTGGEACTETTEKECLAKQQAAPKYDEKTNFDSALKKSEAEEAGKMKSGWKEGKCTMK